MVVCVRKAERGWEDDDDEEEEEEEERKRGEEGRRQRRARVMEDGDLRDGQKGHMVRNLEQRVNKKHSGKHLPSKLEAPIGMEGKFLATVFLPVQDAFARFNQLEFQPN